MEHETESTEMAVYVALIKSPGLKKKKSVCVAGEVTTAHCFLLKWVTFISHYETIQITRMS